MDYDRKLNEKHEIKKRRFDDKLGIRNYRKKYF